MASAFYDRSHTASSDCHGVEDLCRGGVFFLYLKVFWSVCKIIFFFEIFRGYTFDNHQS